jgi:uncharacterized repeat protein (TIGR03803 family)
LLFLRILSDVSTFGLEWIDSRRVQARSIVSRTVGSTITIWFFAEATWTDSGFSDNQCGHVGSIAENLESEKQPLLAITPFEIESLKLPPSREGELISLDAHHLRQIKSCLDTERLVMNPENGKPERAGFFGPNGIVGRKGPGAPRGRRQFRPMVSGLEGRQLMATSALTTVASFSSSQQADVGGLTMDSHGNLYGTTSAGGDGTGLGDSTVFEIANGSKKVTTLASFNNFLGYGINNVVVDGQGNVFGSITQEGVQNSDGRVFEIARGSKEVTTVAQFNGTNGEFPSALTIDNQGNLYGTTNVGYADSGNTVNGATAFEIAKGSNAVTTLTTFNNTGSARNGMMVTAPNGVVVDGQGDLFGTNANGAPQAASTVYEIAKGSNTVNTLAAFGPDSAGVSNVTLDSQGNLFGTTEYGGPLNDGTVFEIPKGSNTVNLFARFNKNNGANPNPNVGLVMDSQGNLYGTTLNGGTNNDGTIFEITPGSNLITTLASFSGTGINASTVSDLMLDGKGDLYGTTNRGGKNGGGTVFKLTLNPQSTSTAITPTSSTTAVSPSSNNTST